MKIFPYWSEVGESLQTSVSLESRDLITNCILAQDLLKEVPKQLDGFYPYLPSLQISTWKNGLDRVLLNLCPKYTYSLKKSTFPPLECNFFLLQSSPSLLVLVAVQRTAGQKNIDPLYNYWLMTFLAPLSRCWHIHVECVKIKWLEGVES